MTSPYSLPDYRSRFFEYKTLTKILGESTIDSIARLHKEVKRNAQKILTTLGGGQNGYLGLVIGQNLYNNVRGTRPFLRPEDPGPFSPTPRRVARAVTRNIGHVNENPLTAEDISLQKIQHDEQLRLYNEVQAVEGILRTHIVEAIDEEYITPLRDANTDMIHQSIPEIFNYLKKSYGQSYPQQLKQREMDIDTLVYDPATNMNTVFIKIQEYQDICQLVGQPKQDYQLVSHAYIIFQKEPIFRESLIRWNRRQNDTTYNHFKTFMRDEYNELNKVGGFSMGSGNFGTMNLVKEIQDMKHQNEQVSNDIKNEIRETLQTLHLNQPEQQYWQPPPFETNPEDQENNYLNGMMTVQQQQSNSLQQLTKQITILQAQLKNLTLSNNSQQQFNPNTSNKLNTDSELNPRTGQPYRRYCWSCGCCTHWSKNCPKKLKGHKDQATFKNRMAGSNQNCL